MNATNLLKSMEGQWRLIRTITSRLQPLPSGTFTGTATITSRSPTSTDFAEEYLYHEDGDFLTDQGLQMKGQRNYVYRLSKEQDQISCWFADHAGKVEYRFHDLTELENKKESLYTAKATPHPCGNDHYESQYQFQCKANMLHEWILCYTVTGPKKDYTTRAVYSTLASP